MVVTVIQSVYTIFVIQGVHTVKIYNKSLVTFKVKIGTFTRIFFVRQVSIYIWLYIYRKNVERNSSVSTLSGIIYFRDPISENV